MLSYLRNAAGFKELGTASVQHFPRPVDDKYANERLYSDPVFAVWATVDKFTGARLGMSDFEQRAGEIIAAGKVLYRMGMVPATSGNFSARLNDGNIAITVSGRHKGELGPDDIMLMDADGKALDDKKPSAEAGLHAQLYRHFPAAGAVLHPHMMNAIVLARRRGDDIYLQNYELLKALDGITTHETQVYVPVFANDQDIPRLAAKVQTYLDDHSPAYAYIIDGHGLYTWGKTMADTLRHVEALDYLFATELKLGS